MGRARLSSRADGLDTIIVSSDYDLAVFCPLCGVPSEEVEVEDYVNSNCLLWCGTHGEVLLCATGCLVADSDIDRIRSGDTPTNPCVRELSRSEALSSAAQAGWDLAGLLGRLEKDKDTDTRFFRTGVLRISHFGRLANDGDDAADLQAVRWIQLSKPVTCFRDVPAEVDTSHDGIYLHYKAVCGKCDRAHVDYIWGD